MLYMAERSRMQSNLNDCVNSIKQNVQTFQVKIKLSVERLQEEAVYSFQRLKEQVSDQLLGHATPVFASIAGKATAAAGSFNRPTLPVFDLSFNPEELKFRLQAVPVYTIVNNRNEFVLVSGEGHKRQLGLLFFRAEDADAMVETLRRQDPKLGKLAKVLSTSMDQIYELASYPRKDSGLEGVVFRFVPDANQVEKALQLYTQAGVPAAAFQGVPLFQAEGLTVKAEQQRFTPLFFSKDDLDRALANAQLTKDADQLVDTQRKVARAQAELSAANAELSGVVEKDRKNAQKKVDTALKRLERYQQRLNELQKKEKQPRVDVGSLEEVIAKMELDEKGEWGDVVFIPSGSLADQNVQSPS